MDTEEALIEEYRKVIDLFMNESRISWELVSIWIVLQIGLISATVLLHVNNAEWGSLGFKILFLAGSISSLAWGLMQYRAKMWRDNWLFFGLKLERELNYRGISTKIFDFEDRVRKKKIALEVFEDQIRERKQRTLESYGALRLPHIAMFILSVIWFALFIASLIPISF